MARTIAVANQKGGVAKTTSCAALGAALAEAGQRVLLVDLDPQASLSYSFGMDPDGLDVTIHDVLVGRVPIGKTIHQLEEVDVVPSNIDLAGAEAYLLTRTGREYALRMALEDVSMHYQFVLIDCPPSLGVLTINALTAADEVVVPLQCEALSHRGVGQLLETIEDVRRLTNKALKVGGIIATMFDPRTQHSREVLADVGRRYGLPMYDPPVRKSIRFAEAPRAGKSILRYASSHPGADAYRQIARRIMSEQD
ncbi:MAG TPA: ParA family protein [Actinomycetota bacterium]|nr:ParA family protein [Actinomycetota bacterium]